MTIVRDVDLVVHYLRLSISALSGPAEQPYITHSLVQGRYNPIQPLMRDAFRNCALARFSPSNGAILLEVRNWHLGDVVAPNPSSPASSICSLTLSVLN